MQRLNRHRPYKKGYLSVGDGHRLYYECCGNKKAPPVLFLHGGPGGGFRDKDKDYFDLKKWNLIIFDQRGAGRSTPFATIKNNTTNHLVKDIDRLLDFLKIEKTFIFGGSWGSTLALVYAIRRPKRVTGMLLRGIFLATKEENEFYIGGGVANFFPQEYFRFLYHVPQKERDDPFKYYFKAIRSKDRKLADRCAYEWSRYEMSILNLVPKPKNVDSILKEIRYKSLSTLEIWYLAQGCFIPEGYILKNASTLTMPISIVQGRYDIICPPISAWRLHHAIPHSRFHLVISGHSSGDPAIKKKLIAELKRFQRNI